MPTKWYFHRFVTAYHFKVDDDITLSPEVMVHNNMLVGQWIQARASRP